MSKTLEHNELVDTTRELLHACAIIRLAVKGTEDWPLLCDAEEKVAKLLGMKTRKDPDPGYYVGQRVPKKYLDSKVPPPGEVRRGY